MSRLSQFENAGKNNIAPLPIGFIIPEDMPIMSILIMGQSVKVTCSQYKELHEVVRLVNRETKRGGWITVTDYPKQTAGGWEWRFVQ